MAKCYGVATPSAFAREVLEVITSGDFDRIAQFQARLFKGLNQQMLLELQEAIPPARKPAQKRRKQAKRGKEAPRHARRS